MRRKTKPETLETLYESLKADLEVKFEACEHNHIYDQIVYTRTYTTVFITKPNSRGFNIWSQNNDEGEGETLAKQASSKDVRSFLYWVANHE